LARGGMELSWRYACVLFTALLAMQLTFPLPAAVCAMVSGAVITRMSMAGGLFNYQKIAFQSACFVLISLLMLYWTQYSGMPFWHFKWAHHLLLEAKSPFQWLILLGPVFFQWLFWQAGRLLVKRSQHYMPICIQFDKGLVFLLALLIVYALVDVRTELDLQNQGIRFVILSFFTFSLASIVLARQHTGAKKSFVSGYRGIGMIVSTLTMIAIFATGITLLAYPYLFHKADALLVILKNTAAPFKPLLIKILLFLVRPRRLKQQDDNRSENMTSIEDLSTPGMADWQADLFKILGVILIALIGLAFLIVSGILVYKLVLWLSKKDPATTERMHLIMGIKRLLKDCRVFLLRIWGKILGLIKEVDSAAMIYYGLLRWGAYSGLTALPSDTPSEYGCRLTRSFPGLKREIHLIVEAFNRELYGGTATDRQTLVRLASAQRRMRDLKHWPSRIRTWLHR
jgi:hypothetical protein